MTDATTSATEATTYAGGCRIKGDDAEVTVRKVFTRMGERLEVTAPAVDESIRLDAMMLESVAWQPIEDLADRAESVLVDQPSNASDTPGDDVVGGTESFTVSNEFALAKVEKLAEGTEDVDVTDGEALRVRAPKLGYVNTLGAAELTWLTLQDHETFSEWLENPFGPEQHDY